MCAANLAKGVVTVADRTVSVRLRADVTAFIAAMRAAERAMNRFGDEAERNARRTTVQFELMRGGADRLERQLRRLAETQQDQSQESRQQSDETRRNSNEQRRNTQENDRNTQSQNRNRRATEQATRGLTAQRATLVSLISLAGAAGAAAVSAAVAMGAFGAVAAPSLIRVVSAQEDLAENWGRLSGLEQESAVLVRTLANEYKELARSYEPQTLGVFNSMISTARGLLPELDELVGDTSGSILTFTNRINDFISDRIGGEFLTWAGQKAPQALDVLGSTAVTAGDTALDLVQDLEPLGIGLLQLTHGTLSAVNAVAGINPMLAQFAVSALLLRAPLMGVANGVSNTRERMRGFAAANAGASRSTRLLHGFMAAGPALYVAAGAALVLFAIHVANAKTETDQLIEGLKISHRAVGNNLDGYRSLRTELGQRYMASVKAVDAAQQKSNRTVQSSKEGTDGARQSVEKLKDEQQRLKEEMQATDAKIASVERATGVLSTRYGVTAEQARRMADAAGVDLSTALDGQGKISNKAAQKLDQYRAAVELANEPMKRMSLSLQDAGNKALTLTDRLKALQSAFEAQFTPSIQAYQATTQLKEGFRQLTEQISKAKGRMDGGSAASLQLRNAFAQQLTTLQNLHQSTFQLTGSQEQANAAVNRYLPILYALAGGNREARAQVDALARVTGFSIDQTNLSRQAFITQAQALFGSKVNADALWGAYQRLTGVTNSGTTATAAYITRVQEAANQSRIQALRTDGARGAQTVYNQRIREALPVLYALAGNNRTARAQVDALARATGNATGATRTSREAFLATARSMGVSETRAEALWKELKKIPRNVHTNVDINAEGKWSNWRSMPGATTGGPAHLVPRAKGGPIPSLGPESSRAYDSVPALLRVDEHVWTPEEVDGAGGHAAVYRLRAMARAGQLQGYARGGRVSLDRGGSTQAVVDDVMSPINRGYAGFITGIVRSMAASWKKYMASGGNAMAWARAQVGKPYLWGGVGPAGYDCSGFTSAITNVIQRRNPHQRRHTTHSFGASGPDGFVRNLQSPFMVGVTDAGVGHMAGTLNGVAVESSGSVGVRVGGGARGANNSMFTRRYGLRMAQGGAVTDAEARLAREALRPGASRREVDLAATLGLTGDPSSKVSPVHPRIPAYGSGGWVRGRPGRDTNLIAATRGEFMINEGQAAKYPGLIEALNSGRIGEALVSPMRRPAPMATAGGGGASLAGGRGGRLVVEVHNHGVIGSRLELQDWLTKSMNDLKKRGRI